ncbi:aminoglycoside adenylyltransferase family protein [Streptomyces sp. NPDC050610]|uniref:aminoglycoside adenylyltransferase family protein n=1 Tax=Streptomyces sp. NPDC050610 TaxID=3157097 RepID=UPI00343462DD
MANSGTGLPEAQAEDVVRVVRRVFGADVVGAYLHGSAVLDGLRPSSDVDVLAVLRRRTTTGERRALVDALLEISGAGDAGAGGARPVELTVVVQGDVRPWRYPPRCEFQYGEWLRAEYERGGTPGPGESPDLAPLITMVLLGDAPLYGPPPAAALDAVPHEDLRRGIAAGVPELLAELADDTRNVVLTLARVWRTLATGEIGSKDAAADWALARLPAEHRPVLVRARAGYLGAERERWDDLLPRLRPYAEYVAAAIERLISGRLRTGGRTRSRGLDRCP